MDDSQKYFIQTLLAARQIKEADAKDVLGIEGDLMPTIHDINSRLSVVNLKISKTVCEITDEIYCCIVPLTYKEETFKQSHFKDNEMAFFKKVILYILEAGTGTVNEDIIEQLGKECFLNPAATDSTINRLIENKYLTRVGDDIVVTPLCVSEFSTFLKLNFKEAIALCKLCQSITINGIKCRSCDTPVHKHCLSMIFEKSHRGKKCPNCSEPWQEAN